MIESESKLKPCPLCGCRAVIDSWMECYEYSRTCIKCTGCGLELNHVQYWYMIEKKTVFGTMRYNRGTRVNEDAITRWNTRVGDQNVSA